MVDAEGAITTPLILVLATAFQLRMLHAFGGTLVFLDATGSLCWDFSCIGVLLMAFSAHR